MPRPDQPNLNQVSLKFGAGRNTRASESEISPIECADGQNFDLDIENTLYSRRKPFDLAATAPNGEVINGFGQLKKSTGDITTLVQAGSTIYEWDFSSTFTSKGTVASGACMRGPLTQNFVLDDTLILTDLNQKQPVSTWDGTTFQIMSTNLSSSFFARYAVVDFERVVYANVKAGATATPHLLAFSESETFSTLSVSDRPSSSLSESDPVFLLSPDLKAINGLLSAFGRIIITTDKGQVHQITGSSAQDFAIDDLYPESGASGEEAIVYIGNDVAWGRPGRIESLFATEALGDVETDDLSRQIADDITDVSDWLLAYSSRQKRLYCWDRSRSRIHVLHKSFVDERVRANLQQRSPTTLSPWSLWTTQDDSAFQTNVCMPLIDPSSGVEEVFFGGPSGKIFKFDGGGGQDAGTADLKVSRTSRVFRPELPGPVFDVDGIIRYRKIFPATVTLTLQLGGEVLEDNSITISLPAAENLPVYAGGLYYNDDEYYSAPFKGRFSQQRWGIPGRSNEFQLKVEVEGSTDFFIEEVLINFRSV